MSSRKRRGSVPARRNTVDHRLAYPPGQLYWWLLAFLFLLGSRPGWMSERVRVVDWRSDAVLAPDGAWSTPLADWDSIDRFAQWPFCVFALVAAWIVSRLGVRLSGTLPVSVVVCFVSGAALSFPPKLLVPAAAVISIASVCRPGRQRTRPGVRWGQIAGLSVAAVLLTHEFGFVWLLTGLLLAEPMNDSDSPAKVTALGANWQVCALIAVVMCLGWVAQSMGSGFAATMLRPVNWLNLTSGQSLLPSLAPAFEQELQRLPLLLMALMPVCIGSMLIRQRDPKPISLPLLVTFVSLGLGCAHFLWLCLFGIAAGLVGDDPEPVRGRFSRSVQVAALIASVLCSLGHIDTYREYFAGEEQSRRRVSPDQWRTSGPVILLDLTQSQDWQSSTVRSRFPLLVDDRWEAFNDFYDDYAAVCRDFTEVRIESYLRTDGSWGGYTHWLREWKPALLVCSSGELPAIRSLSLSPHWKLAGIDPRRTVFGRDNDGGIAPAIRETGRALARLEFSSIQTSPTSSSIALPADAHSRQRIAGVLNAIRLPFAALKTLSAADHNAFARSVRQRCYHDLAHRTHRHTGEVSLLDQFRAARRSRTGIGLKSAGGDNADASVSQQVESLDIHSESSGWALQERLVRRALLQGDAAEAQQLAAELEPAIRRWYATLANSQAADPVDLLVDLIDCIHEESFPARLDSEAWFYAGCLAIEVGDPAIAAEAFLHSRDADADSPFQALRQFYLSQLSNH